MVSTLRRWLSLLNVFHSCSHCAQIRPRMNALSLEKRGRNECVLPGLVASLNNLSVMSFPGSSQCPGTHWRRRAIPRALTSVAACKMARVIRCPDLLPEFPRSTINWTKYFISNDQLATTRSRRIESTHCSTTMTRSMRTKYLVPLNGRRSNMKS